MKLHPHEYTRYVKLAGNETTSTPEGDPITVNSIGFESEGGYDWLRKSRNYLWWCPDSGPVPPPGDFIGVIKPVLGS